MCKADLFHRSRKAASNAGEMREEKMIRGILACMENWDILPHVVCGQAEPGLWIRCFLTLKSGPLPCQVCDFE